MHQEYSVIALLCVGGMIFLAGIFPVDFELPPLDDDEELQDGDFDMEEEILYAIQTNTGAATTSSM